MKVDSRSLDEQIERKNRNAGVFLVASLACAVIAIIVATLATNVLGGIAVVCVVIAAYLFALCGSEADEWERLMRKKSRVEQDIGRMIAADKEPASPFVLKEHFAMEVAAIVINAAYVDLYEKSAESEFHRKMSEHINSQTEE